MSKIYEAGMLEIAAGWLRAIGIGIERAGGDPRFDLPRMVDLADQIGALIMDKIFHTEHAYKTVILGQKNAAQALHEAGWTIDAQSYGGKWLWDAFSRSLGNPDLDLTSSPKTRLFELVSPQREIRGREMLTFFENGRRETCHPNMAVELVLRWGMHDQGWITCPCPRDVKVGAPSVSMSLNPTDKQYSLHPFFRVNFPKGYPILTLRQA